MLRVSEDGNRRREGYIAVYRQLGRSLLDLEEAADRIFDTISERIAQERDKVSEISKRIQNAKAEIDALSQSKQKLVIQSPSRYPSTPFSETGFHPLFGYRNGPTDVDIPIAKLLVNGGLNREFGLDGTLELFQFFSEADTTYLQKEVKLKEQLNLTRSRENTYLGNLLGPPNFVDRRCESTPHFFIRGTLARTIWQNIANIFNIRISHQHTLQQRVSRWMGSYRQRSHLNTIRKCMPPIILWELWVEKNCRRFDKTRLTSQQITLKILNWARELPVNIPNSYKLSLEERLTLDILRCKVNPRKGMLAKFVKWIPPLHGFKLNTDGASKGNPGLSAGGGIIRNRERHVIVAFAHTYGFGNSFTAEMQAVMDGIDICNMNNFRRILIESDSASLVSLLRGNGPGPWTLRTTIRTMRELLTRLEIQITHIYREANGVADALANFGILSQFNCRFDHEEQLPSKVKLALFSDKMGLPFLRCS